jgi:hypothetical protein
MWRAQKQRLGQIRHQLHDVAHKAKLVHVEHVVLVKERLEPFPVVMYFNALPFSVCGGNENRGLHRPPPHRFELIGGTRPRSNCRADFTIAGMNVDLAQTATWSAVHSRSSTKNPAMASA